jgi:Cu(I)/Ag(I) efflux system membrane protein CusA/SilA
LSTPPPAEGAWERGLGFFIDNKLVVVILLGLLVVAGLSASPFRLESTLPRDPVAVDAIPDIGENQQIVFTEWAGRSPRDIEDQVTYPLTTALLGMPGVRTVRSFSMFGFSTIYVIFEDGVDFYWSRSRVLEKLTALPDNTLPEGASPALGPDATALGQVFWYTLQGQDGKGAVTGGWDPHELRSVQDWTVRYALQSVPGVSEVASVGGYVREYQVDVDPEALLARKIGIDEVARAVGSANLDVGARTLEINKAEFVVRGVGFIQNVADLEQVVVRSSADHTPIRVGDLAKVGLGPAQRRGALDDAGAPAVGGIVVVRFGANPLEVIERVKAKIAEISPGLPQKQLEDGRSSQIRIVPFYDRTGLIQETLGTLSTALWQEIVITVIVILILLRHFRSSLLVSAMLPLGVLFAFVAMRQFGVDGNIMALSGIAIAIGTMVDLGIVLTENIVEHLESAPEGQPRNVTVRRAAAEVAPAVVTSTLTTLLGFLPIFGLTASEGKLFAPLAYTKSFAMVGALALALIVLPAAAHLLLRARRKVSEPVPRSFGQLLRISTFFDLLLAAGAVWAGVRFGFVFGALLLLVLAARVAERHLPERTRRYAPWLANTAAVVVAVIVLSDAWLPLGPERGFWANRLFVTLLLGSVLGTFSVFLWLYPRLLGFFLRHKIIALGIPTLLVVAGFTAWRGFDKTFGWLPQSVRLSDPVARLAHAVPGFGREYMPPFDEGSYLFMPTTMPHASIGQAQEQLQLMDAAIAEIPEIDRVVGKLGRAESPLDPAPISMFETVISYKSEYALDPSGRRIRFRYDQEKEAFPRDATGTLIEDAEGRPFRQWRAHIKSPKDIWKEIQEKAAIPGVTSAPELMPIAARIVMLQSGMRAPMGLKIRGPDLSTLEAVALELEGLLRQVPKIRPETVVADRIVGKPYLEIVIDRESIARHGISMMKVQEVIQTAVGGRTVTRTVEGRERYPVRVRVMREERGDVESVRRTLVPTPLGHQIPLEQLSTIRYVRGPQVIKSEDTFMTAYVVFDKLSDAAEVDVVEDTRAFLDAKVASGEFKVPAGVSYTFAGSYENQVRSEKRLAVLFPLALALIFLLLYLQFRRVSTTLMIFSSVLVAMSGGFLYIWLYGQPWFLDASPAGVDLRTLFQVHTVNMSVAVWVGFIALVGIATDDGVVMSTYLKQRFAASVPESLEDVRQLTLEAGVRRVRPCLMTTATTLLALLPVVTSTGRGADVMAPMALPLIGGMGVELLTLFVIPVLYCMGEEWRLRRRLRAETQARSVVGAEAGA